ncbi:MAG: phosphomethylpyrimidine synthase ThiC, partial [Chloroflexi bacterium]|nr:phosphomethylpyrimidine synthase ThiC [Chloroflexota bacterium]
EDVRQGVMAARLAAHAADIAKGIKGAADWDREMSAARKNLAWERQAELALDPQRVRQVHAQHGTSTAACSMCGPYCAMELVAQYLGIDAVERC